MVCLFSKKIYDWIKLSGFHISNYWKNLPWKSLNLAWKLLHLLETQPLQYVGVVSTHYRGLCLCRVTHGLTDVEHNVLVGSDGCSFFFSFYINSKMIGCCRSLFWFLALLYTLYQPIFHKFRKIKAKKRAFGAIGSGDWKPSTIYSLMDGKGVDGTLHICKYVVCTTFWF